MDDQLILRILGIGMERPRGLEPLSRTVANRRLYLLS